MTSAIDRPYKRRLLTDRDIDAEVDLGILDRLQDHGSLIAIGSIQPDSSGQLG